MRYIIRPVEAPLVAHVNVHILVAGPSGVWEEHGHNLVTNAGMNQIRDFLATDTVAGITHFAIGTASTAVSLTQTALSSEILRDVVTSRIKDGQKLTVKYFLGTGQANGSTIREAGLFNAAALGAMYARYVLSTPINKNALLTTTFSWELTWATG